MKYDYSKLKGLIYEKYGNQSNFAEAYGISRQAMSYKMTDRSDWSRVDMMKACDILDQPYSMIPTLFFTAKHDKTSS